MPPDGDSGQPPCNGKRTVPICHEAAPRVVCCILFRSFCLRCDLGRASYSWTEHYEAAVLELDHERLLAQITKAEALIERRKEELQHTASTGDEERQAIIKALRVLALLKEIAGKHD